MNIIKNRKKFSVISIIIILIGIIMFFIQGLNYGIDFTGGTLIEIDAGKFIDAEEVREIIKKYDSDISVIHGGEKKEQLIIKSTLDLSNEDIIKITDEFSMKYNINKDNISSEKIGPSMGQEIRKKAIISVIVATIAMLLYITVRFEFNFGLAAIIALIHDVLIVISFYSILNLQINSSFIAVILTIVGYSINDTIVIFDRVREKRRLYPKWNAEKLVNQSVKASIRRTMNTTITTVTAVIILYIVGVEDVKALALPLAIGMLTGTYSSMLIAPSVWYDLETYKSKTA